ncbi:hypothetical protein FGO68_gene8547 [Halteria grandinella]|uniref:PH domain-containing protein n=1 Tax=Halteria grandinella TaxID=5974 RepID=A0A8J8SW04_HALGN|nr:hypothetical protein FGO68_gene8547 [Halteria grandinella]
MSRKNSWVDLNDEMSDSDQHEIVWKGVLKKRTSYKMSQQRTFVLYMDGRLEYYKDEVLYRGVLQLIPSSKVNLAVESIDGRLSLFPGKKWVLRLTLQEGGKDVRLSAQKQEGKSEEDVLSEWHQRIMHVIDHLRDLQHQ